MKKYWLTLYPDTFLWVKHDFGCIYNAVNYSKIKFDNTVELTKLTNELLDINSLYRVELSEDFMQKQEINEWIEKIISSESGMLVENDGLNKRPVSFKPQLKLQDGVEYYKWEHRQGIDGNIIHNLHKIIFHLNGSNYGNLDYAKQELYPTKNVESLDSQRVLLFVKNARCSLFLSEIILIGDISCYPDFEKLVSSIFDIGFEKISVYCLERDFLKYVHKVSDWNKDKILYSVLISDYTSFKEIMKVEGVSSVSFRFFIRSAEEYEQAMSYIDKDVFINVELIPLYTGNNLSFLEDNLYMNDESLSEIELTKREVFIRQSLNVFSFGNLSILPNGDVYANLNDPSIGTIDESPHNIVYREMTEGKSWLRIRNKKPCNECIYQWLCPSPSNYELILGKSNLCFKK